MIASKLRKDIVDYFFLNDTEKLAQYTQPNLFNKLNPLEMILLIFALKDKTPDLTQKTLNYFQSQQDLLKVDAEQMDKLFSFHCCFPNVATIWSYIFPQISNSIGRETIGFKESQNTTVG